MVGWNNHLLENVELKEPVIKTTVEQNDSAVDEAEPEITLYRELAYLNARISLLFDQITI